MFSIYVSPPTSEHTGQRKDKYLLFLNKLTLYHDLEKLINTIKAKTESLARGKLGGKKRRIINFVKIFLALLEQSGQRQQHESL